jgi:hypothetical protein
VSRWKKQKSSGAIKGQHKSSGDVDFGCRRVVDVSTNCGCVKSDSEEGPDAAKLRAPVVQKRRCVALESQESEVWQ